MRYILTLLALLTFSFSVLAQDAAPESPPAESGQPNSERLHQTLAGKWDVTPQVGLGVSSTDYTAEDVRGTSLSNPVGVSGEYGISPNFSLGASLGYTTIVNHYTCGSGILCSDHNSKGVNDPDFFFKSQFALGRGTLRAGLHLTVALEHHTINSSGDNNQASGGTTLTPFLAYELPIASGILGARVTYDIYQSDRKIDDSTGSSPVNYTLGGGEETTADIFYEYNLRKVTFGGALLYARANGTRINQNGVTTPNNDSTSLYGFQAYFPVRFNQQITLLPMATYASYNYPSGYMLSYQSAISLACGARFTF